MKTTLVFLFLLIGLGVFGQTYEVNQPVMIQYQNAWFPGKILKIESEGYLVSFDEYDESWNEVVQTDRLRPTGDYAPTTNNSESSETTQSTSGDELSTQQKIIACCECWEKANKSGILSEKEACLDLQDKYKATLPEDGEDYGNFKQQVHLCKQGIAESSGIEQNMDPLVKEVCDCFQTAKEGGRERSECFRLQGTLAGDIEDEDKLKTFLLESSKCDN